MRGSEGKMFYKIELKTISVYHHTCLTTNVTRQSWIISYTYENHVSKDLGFVVNVVTLHSVEEGVIVPGDGAAFLKQNSIYYVINPNSTSWCTVKYDITDFGAFLDLGATEGMVHISQSMDDFVSFSKRESVTR